MADTLWSKDILDPVVSWLEQAYPVEGCGLIVEKDGEYRVLECENLADKYHDMDPEQFPRTAREFYIIDPMEFMRAEDRGEQVVVIFHSHADVGDYFSDEDVAAATLPSDDDSDPLEPSHPGVDYLVVSTREDGADHATVFRFSEEQQGFPPIVDIQIDDGEYQIEEI
ncbi:MAG: Mov34/MPN/PAD-1 family protein [Persicimonas sp.]